MLWPLKRREKAFADRKAAAKRKIDSLKHYLTDALGGQNFSSDRCAVSFRRSKAVCVLDEAAVPAEYMTGDDHPHTQQDGHCGPAQDRHGSARL